MRLVQLVPRVAPGREAVSAFATALGEALRSETGCESTLASPDVAVDAGPGFLGDPANPPTAVLLHYVGYGYDPRGVPRELARAWEQARAEGQRRGVRFGVMFHEVAAFGPPWRSSFWTHPSQRRIARRMLGVADAAITSLESYRRLLGGRVSGKSVEVIGIPSTVGEPASVSDFDRREPRLVVFGSAGVRRRVWDDFRSELDATARRLDVDEIVDVGAEAGAPESHGGRPVIRLGVAPAPAISRLLGAARGGFLAYPPDFLGKSTVHGAYAAHGVVPVCSWHGRQWRDPRPDEPWTAPDSDVEPARVAARARDHYSTRSLARHASAWRRLLGLR